MAAVAPANEDGADPAPRETPEPDRETETVEQETAVETKKSPFMRAPSMINPINMPPPPEDAPDTLDYLNEEEVDQENEHLSKWQARRKELLHPHSVYSQIWNLAMVVVLLYNVFLLPMRATFPKINEEPLNTMYYVLDYFTDALLIVDIVRHFFLSVNYMGSIVNDHKIIRKVYGRSFKFALDVATVVPIDLFLLGSVPRSTIAIARFNRALRLHRVNEYFRTWERTTAKGSIFRALKVFLIIALITHWGACLFHEIVRSESRYDTSWQDQTFDEMYLNRWSLGLELYLDQPTFSPYVRALLWVIQLFTNVGTNSNFPQTILEYIFTLITLAMGMVVYAIMVVHVGNLVVSQDAAAADFKDKMDVVNLWMDYKGTNPKLQTRIRSYFEYLWLRQAGLQDVDILDDLPMHLRSKVTEDLNFNTLRKVPLFKQCRDEGFLMSLMRSLRPEVYTPGDYIVREGEMGASMFFITRGEVNVKVLAKGNEPVNTLKDGEYFGEVALLFKARRNASIQAVTFVDVFVLSKEDVDRALLDFPVYADQMYDMAKARLAQDPNQSMRSSHGRGAGMLTGRSDESHDFPGQLADDDDRVVPWGSRRRRPVSTEGGLGGRINSGIITTPRLPSSFQEPSTSSQWLDGIANLQRGLNNLGDMSEDERSALFQAAATIMRAVGHAAVGAAHPAPVTRAPAPIPIISPRNVPTLNRPIAPTPPIGRSNPPVR